MRVTGKSKDDLQSVMQLLKAHRPGHRHAVHQPPVARGSGGSSRRAQRRGPEGHRLAGRGRPRPGRGALRGAVPLRRGAGGRDRPLHPRGRRQAHPARAAAAGLPARAATAATARSSWPRWWSSSTPRPCSTTTSSTRPPSRRGRRSVNSRWGNDITVLLGDFLYTKSMSMALSQDNLRILRLLSDVTLRMIEGELLEIERNGDLEVSEAQHLDIIRRKTADLFSACMRIGGHAGRGGRGARARPRQLRPEPRHLLPDGGRPARLHRRREGAGQAGGQRPARGQAHPARDLPAAAGRAGRARRRCRRCWPTAGSTASPARSCCAWPASTAPSTRRARWPSATRTPARQDLLGFERSPYREALAGPARLHPRPRPLEATVTLAAPDADRPAQRDARTASTSFAREIRRHERLYYVEAQPEIADARVRPALPRAARPRGGRTPSSSRPTAPPSAWGASRRASSRPFAHRVPMLSLDNTYSEEELREFEGRIFRQLGERAVRLRGRAEDRRALHGPALRGRASSCAAVTRGDGVRGDDVTAERARHPGRAPDAARRRTCPARWRCAARCSSRARASRPSTASGRSAGEETFANPRNVAAGTMKNLDPRVVAERGLDIYLYSIAHVDGRATRARSGRRSSSCGPGG